MCISFRITLETQIALEAISMLGTINTTLSFISNHHRAYAFLNIYNEPSLQISKREVFQNVLHILKSTIPVETKYINQY